MAKNMSQEGSKNKDVDFLIEISIFPNKIQVSVMYMLNKLYQPKKPKTPYFFVLIFV